MAYRALSSAASASIRRRTGRAPGRRREVLAQELLAQHRLRAPEVVVAQQRVDVRSLGREVGLARAGVQSQQRADQGRVAQADAGRAEAAARVHDEGAAFAGGSFVEVCEVEEVWVEVGERVSRVGLHRFESRPKLRRLRDAPDDCGTTQTGATGSCPGGSGRHCLAPAFISAPAVARDGRAARARQASGPTDASLQNCCPSSERTSRNEKSCRKNGYRANIQRFT